MRRTEEEMGPNRPLIFRSSGHRFYDDQGTDVTKTLPSTFKWKPIEIGVLEYRNGWTRFGVFFADGYFTAEDLRELIAKRFGGKYVAMVDSSGEVPLSGYLSSIRAELSRS